MAEEIPATETAPAVETKPAAETTPATETKPVDPKAETKPAADAKPASETKPAAEAVDYAKALADAVPEGMKLDEAGAKPFVEAFAKHNLSAEAVKDLVALNVAREKAGADGAAAAFAAQVTAWKTESTADPALGAENMGLAKTTAAQVFDTKTIELMEHFGLMNHAGVLKGLVKVGKSIKDDSFVGGNAARQNGFDPKSLYPNSDHAA